MQFQLNSQSLLYHSGAVNNEDILCSMEYLHKYKLSSNILVVRNQRIQSKRCRFQCSVGMNSIDVRIYIELWGIVTIFTIFN